MENELARGFLLFIVENCSSIWKKISRRHHHYGYSDEQIIILTILDAKPLEERSPAKNTFGLSRAQRLVPKDANDHKENNAGGYLGC